MAMDEIEVRLLRPGEAGLLAQVADEVFDEPVDLAQAAAVLAAPFHWLAVARDGGLVVGMASAQTYLRPDKPPEMWINEVGVAPPWQRRGLARRLVTCLLAVARAEGCAEAWVATEPENGAARLLYARTGADGPDDVMVYVWDVEAD